MKTFIPQRLVNLIIILGIFDVFASCNASTKDHLDTYTVKKLKLVSGEELKIYIADSNSKQRKGLSEIKSSDFSAFEGMLFPAQSMKIRQFWMPKTYFNLDLFFLNQDHFIIDIHRNLKHSKSHENKEDVQYSKEVYCQDVLELRADSEAAKKLKVGMQLKFD